MNDLLERLANLSPEKRDLVLKKLQERGLVTAVDEALQRPPITPVSRDQPLPLSFAQQRLWFIDQWEPGNPFYNIPAAVRLSGPLDVNGLAHSLNGVVQRHESLRTTFAAHDGQPVQVIAPSLTLPLPLVDLQALPQETREAETHRLAACEALAPFDLAHGLLLRALILHLAPQEHILLVTMHHIVSDGWSTGVFIQEMAALYLAALAGGPSPLPELPIQYADFSLWQRQWLQGDVLEQQLAFWQQQLGGAPTALDLPTDRPRPALQTFHGDTLSFTLPASLSQALLALSRKHNATPFMTLLAAFNVLLHRYTSQDDVLLGSPIANRHHRQTEGLIGFFVNTLVLRTRLSAADSFRVLLQQVRETTLQAYAYQDLPFEMLVEQLQPERDLSRTPLFQVMFALQNNPLPPPARADLSFTFLETDSQTAKFDMTLLMAETDQGLDGNIVYNTDLFDGSTIARMIDHFQVLLAGIVTDADRRLSDLFVLTAAEQQQLLTWNDTETDYPPAQCFHELFQTQTAQTPDAIAALFQDQHLTYRALNERANQLAHHLQEMAVGPEVLVGLCLERSLDVLVGLLGIFKTGGAYVPLEPAYPPARLAFMLADAQVAVLLTHQDLLARLPASLPPVVCLDANWPRIAQAGGEDLDNTATTDNLAYVIYTSGSTGQPKGVPGTHRSLVNYLRWFNQTLFEATAPSLPAITRLTFDASLKQLLAPLLQGREVWLISDDVAAQPGALVRSLGDRSEVSFNCVPTLWRAMFEALAYSDEGAPAMPITRLLVGGEALDAKSVADTLAAWPHLQVWNLYGPTEATANASATRITLDARITLGYPIANTRLYVLDAHGQPAPTGALGELHIAGQGLARGYLRRPALTAKRFVPHPLSQEPSERLYRTGDLARYLPDGRIEYLGRIDHQVKIRGFRIELGEIEATLVAHPAVQQAVALVREDEPGQRRLVAYVVPTEGQDLASGELRRFLQERLPDYMLPSAFVTLEALPLTPSGKIDRRALPLPDRARREFEETFTAPRSPLEEVLAGIWSQVLNIERVGVTDNFFDLGGHSLLATQVMSRIGQAFQVELPLRALFEAPTIAALAERVADARQAEQGLSLPPLLSASREGPLPLSFAQQRLWFIDQWEPGSPFYNLPAAVRLTGPLHLPALAASLNGVVQRHESLRTTFAAHDGQPVQVITPSLTLPLPLVDLQVLPQDAREAEAHRLAACEALAPFDLARGPLLRALVLRLPPQDHILLITMHHIVSDGWSTGIFIQEMAALYLAALSGEPSPLPELPIQYADFSLWQREWLQGDVLEQQLAFWQQQLDGAPTALDLPTDRPRPALQTFHGDTLSFTLPAPLTQALLALGRKHNATPFMALLAAFNVLLHRYTGQDDVLLGSPIANRHHRQTEGLIGFFVNTLVLRTHLSAAASFRALLQQVRETTLQAYAYQDLPFEMLVEQLQPERDLSRTPLFQVMFALQNAPTPPMPGSGLSFAFLQADSHSAKFDLTLVVAESPDGFRGDFEYNTDLFDEATIARLAQHWQTLLEGIAANPDRPLADLPLLTEAERGQVLLTWNDIGPAYPHDRCLHELFQAQVAHTPDALALFFQEHHLTYQALNRRANQLAHHLQTLGAGPGTFVALCFERGLDMLVALLATLKAGSAYLPLDPAYPQERLAFLLDDTQSPLLLTQRHLLDRLPAHSAQVLCLDADWPAVAQSSADNPHSPVCPDDLAYVIYTSGSTGLPKGVTISHAALCPLLHWGFHHLPLSPDDRSLQYLAYIFDWSVWEMFLPLTSGASLFLVTADLVLDPQATLDLMAEQHITVLHGTPTQFHYLTAPGQPLTSLRYACIGAEKLTFDLALRTHGLLSPDCRLFNMYGPTEATIMAAVLELDRRNLEALRRLSSVPIGPPIANNRCYVLDAHLHPQPTGVPGELYIAGGGLARNYLGRPALTAERFVPDPFHPQARAYRTGDLVKWLPDGALEFLGRIDYQVKLRGFRIELGEIEATLVQHPAVQQAVALVREDEPGQRRLVAYVVPTEGQDLASGELRRFLQERLPDYMLPSAFVTLEALPLTPSGKIDRRALPLPDRARREFEETFTAPLSPLEEVLAGIWSQVLNIERVGVTDNFFDLGGHSLLATQVMSRIGQAFQVELPLRALFEAPTIAALAERVADARQAEQGLSLPPLLSASREGPLPLSFAQQRLWFIDQWEPGSPFYNLPAAVRLTGPLHLPALAASLNGVVQRHESLRTTFAAHDGQPVQVITPSLTLTLPLVDLQALPQDAREAEAHRLAACEALAPFDLARGPLLRALVLRLPPQDHILLITMHHIVSDGWSTGIFIQEMAALYLAALAGGPSPLPELPIQYADFSLWQREWLQGDVLEQQLAFWQQQLDGAPTALDLPTDRPRPALQTFHGDTLSFTLPAPLTQALLALGRKHNATPFMALLAAFNVLLQRYTGQDDVLLGSPIANRHHRQTEALIGFFVNTLVLRTHLSAAASFRTLLEQVRETTLQAYAYQDLPFEMLVEQLQPERDLSRTPLFQVMFALQNAPTPPMPGSGLSFAFLQADSHSAKFDLTLVVAESPDGFRGDFEYNTDLFDEATIARLAQHWQTLLEGIAADPDRPLADLPLLTEAERGQVLLTWNDIGPAYPHDRCLHELFQAQVAHTPDALALFFQEHHLTYQSLDRRANQLAHHLQTLGAGPGTFVALCFERGLDMLTAILAVLKAGSAYLPLDPAYPQERLAFLLDDTQAPLLLTQRHLLDRLPAHDAQVLCLDADWPAIAQASHDDPRSSVSPDDLAYVIYTSGSTGLPKGVTISHAALCPLLHWGFHHLPLSPDDRSLQYLAYIFDWSVWEMFLPLTSGASLFLVTADLVLDPQATLDLMAEQHITVLHGTPTQFHYLTAPGQPLLSLRYACIGAEKLTFDLAQRTHDLLSPDCRLFNMYGPTEATIMAAVLELDRRNLEPLRRLSSVPIGPPIANNRCYVLDAHLHPQPTGVPGELYIAGGGLARSYLGRPALTAERFVPDPFHPQARAYRTGDLVKWLPDGALEFLGRIDYQVKLRGFRIELGEIEATLVAHPTVQQAVALVREDQPGDRYLAAYVLPQPGHTPDPVELRAFLQERLPDYMLPAAILALDALPQTPSGKVDRKALPSPHRDGSEQQRAYVAPHTATEEKLAAIFGEVLGLERVGIHDGFFELGGHSLIATQLISRINQAFQVNLPIRTVFERTTIAQLAELLFTKQIEQVENDVLEDILAEMDGLLDDDEIAALLSKEES